MTNRIDRCLRICRQRKIDRAVEQLHRVQDWTAMRRALGLPYYLGDHPLLPGDVYTLHVGRVYLN